MIRVGYCGMGGGSYSAKELRPLIESLGMTLTIISEWEDADVRWDLNTWQSELIKCDILVAPIDYMRFPYKGNNKLTQFMSFGKPVIASPLQSYREVITQGENGYIADSMEAWSKFLTQLRDNEALRAKIGNNAKATVEKFFSVKETASELVRTFDQAASTIDIIIPSYNNSKYLQATVDSIIKNTKSHYVIHIVDSSTTDPVDSVIKSLKERSVPHTFKKMPGRSSFSEQVNWGMEHSQNNLILIGNNDLLFTDNWDQPLREFLKANPDSIVQPLSNCDKGWLHNYDLTTSKGVKLEPGLHSLESFDQEDLFSSKALLVRSEHFERKNVAFYCVLFYRTLLEKIGVLDAAFLNGGEDFDYCYRASKAGYRCFNVNNSFVFHFGGKTRKVSENENFARHHEEDQFNNSLLTRKLSKSILAFYLGAGWEKWDETNLIKGGIGGSETAAIWMARELSKFGYQVKVFADPDARHMDSTGLDVEYIPHTEWKRFSKSNYIDFLVSSRTVAPFEDFYHAYKKYVWIHDVFLNQDRGFDCHTSEVNNYLCLSDWHKEFVHEHHGIPLDKLLVTTNGIDPSRYKNKVEKNPHQIFYSSSPDRGLDTLLYCSDFIKTHVPDLKIIVAYGFENWEKAVRWRNDAGEVARMEDIKKELGKSQVQHLGRVDQNTLAQHQLQSSAWLYPTRFHETNCITAIEAGNSGNAILASKHAGLITTVKDSGILLEGDAYSKEYREQFIHNAIQLLTNAEYKKAWADRASERMRKFTWQAVAAQWHKLFQDNVFDSIN